MVTTSVSLYTNARRIIILL